MHNMSIPTADREQILISSLGKEEFSYGIILKSTYWYLFMTNGCLSIGEYEGLLFPQFREDILKLKVSYALDINNNVMTDKFWLWEIRSDFNLYLVEIEPFVNQVPLVSNTYLIATNVISHSINIDIGDSVRVQLLTNTIPKQLWLRIYPDIRNAPPTIETRLNWSDTRNDDFDFIFPQADRTTFQNSYIDTASPPNIYAEDNSLTVPNILNAVQVGVLKQILVTWDTVIGGEYYRLERSLNDPTFSPANTVIAYYGTSTTYQDTVPLYATTYYYRVKLVMQSYAMESLWSSGYSVAIGVFPMVTDFIAIPQSGDADLQVQFTDLTTTNPTSWVWDFGDGYTSTEQNPSHTYIQNGLFSVRLQTANVDGNSELIKSDYIEVALKADFIGTPTSGETPLIVQFTDTSKGMPTSWAWDFGDGYTSTEQNPSHTFTQSKKYTITLTASNINGSDQEIKIEYIVAEMKGLFRASSTYGYSSVLTYFKDKTTGFPAPNYWAWDFGDGTPIKELQNPVHQYTELGTYTVTLTIRNSLNLEQIITRENYITVTSLKQETISIIQNVADNSGNTQVIEELGSSGYAWDRDSENKYKELEVFVEGLTNAVINRTIKRGDPLDGALFKSIALFISPHLIKLDNVYGIFTGDTFGVNNSIYNNGGKNVTNVSIPEDPEPPIGSSPYVNTLENINAEFFASVPITIGPPTDDMNIEDTIKRIQASIFDAIPKQATTTVPGFVYSMPWIGHIFPPTNELEERLNELLIIMMQAGWLPSVGVG